MDGGTKSHIWQVLLVAAAGGGRSGTRRWGRMQPLGGCFGAPQPACRGGACSNHVRPFFKLENYNLENRFFFKIFIFIFNNTHAKGLASIVVVWAK